jgi:hypothetical protein
LKVRVQVQGVRNHLVFRNGKDSYIRLNEFLL